MNKFVTFWNLSVNKIILYYIAITYHIQKIILRTFHDLVMETDLESKISVGLDYQKRYIWETLQVQVEAFARWNCIGEWEVRLKM